MFITFAWLINLVAYYLLARAVILITPTLIKYGETHQMDSDKKMIYDALCNFTDRVGDYLQRHDTDFNLLEFQPILYKMFRATAIEGIQDRVLAEVGTKYDGKLRWGAFETPENKIERLNTTVGWDSKEYIGFRIGWKF